MHLLRGWRGNGAITAFMLTQAGALLSINLAAASQSLFTEQRSNPCHDCTFEPDADGGRLLGYCGHLQPSFTPSGALLVTAPLISYG